MNELVNGYCDERFAGVKSALQGLLESGQDVGACFSASWKGETVVDIWGGYQDEQKIKPWEENTIINVFSTTKTMSFLCALILADRGELDFDAPVADYWPEFAAAGKEQVLVWHIMNHAAGLSGMDELMTQEDLYDWEKMTSALAAQKPWWEPGTKTAYHALTQGYLIGEVVRRITGQTLGQFFRKEVAEPLQADFHIGVPESEFARIANLIPPEISRNLEGSGDQDSIAVRTFKNPAPTAESSWTDAWRRAEIPAANGHGNARAVARIHSVLANLGEAHGVKLLSEQTARSVMKARISGEDEALKMPIAFGLGFGLSPDSATQRNLCFWGGWGGSTAVIDQDNQLAYSYVMNRMDSGLMGDNRGLTMSGAVYQSLAALG